MLSGGFDERLTSRRVQNRAGTLVAKPAGAHHANVYTRVRTASILIYPLSDALQRLERTARAFGRVGMREGAQILKLGRRLRRFLHDEEDDTVQVELDELLCELGGISPPCDRSAGIPPWLKRVRDELIARAATPVSIGEVARCEGVSLATVAKAFRRVYGITPTATIREARISHAKRLLVEPGMTLSAVAFATGFADQAHFTRTFKQETALTPGHYRRRTATP